MFDFNPLIKAVLNNIEDLEEWEEKEVKDCIQDLEKAISHLSDMSLSPSPIRLSKRCEA